MEQHRTPEFLTPLESKTKNYTWLYILIIIVLGGLNVYQFLNAGKGSEKKADAHQNQAEIHADSAKVHFERYKGREVKDSALEKSYDSLMIQLNQLKNKSNEKYKVIDRYGVSDMQSYFNERTGTTTTAK